MLGIALVVIAQLPEPGGGGDIAPFLVIFVVGFVIAVIGHVIESRDLILAGILIAGAAASLPWLVLS